MPVPAFAMARLIAGLMGASATIPSPVKVWITTESGRQEHLTLARPQAGPAAASTTNATSIVTVDPDRTYQTILGLGASLEHSTCSNLFRIPRKERVRAMERLVDPDRGIGMNLMRVSIGTSDFTGEPWYSYDDLPAGQTDPGLRRFSIDRDRAYILPCLQLALRRNPALKFFASPWSPPGWMKTTGTMIGGELRREWYPAYAEYFVRFVQAYAAEGVPIHAVTVQNEPGVDRARSKDPKWHYPSCHWTAEQERDFIRDHLGPAFRRAGLRTRIWCYDHNYNVEPTGESDGLAHPRTILQDPAAARFVSGVAFHHYEGQPDGMTRFHEEFPTVPIHFTEGSVFTLWGGHDLVERLRNWATSYNAWVTMLDDRGLPNNGPFPASHAILKLHADTGRVEELFEFSLQAHFSQYVRRGAVRLGSEPSSKDISHVAFRNPDGTRVLVVVNTTERDQVVPVRGGGDFDLPLPARSMATCTWKAWGPLRRRPSGEAPKVPGPPAGRGAS